MATKNSFLVISPHTPEECISALDEVAAQGKEALEHWEWGCMAGDHTGYGKIEADREASALREVPEMVREKARAVRVSRFTMDEIRSLHEKYA